MKRLLVLLLILFPLTVQASSEAAFLNPKITGVDSSLVCPELGECQAVFIIDGKNFVNTNGIGAVRIGDDWAEIIKWADTSIVAITDAKNIDRTASVTVDTTLHKPKIETDDPVIAEMFRQSIDIALASIHQARDGSRYIVAGPRYATPPRIYYRDTYWTSGLILMTEPSVIRDQIRLLAHGVEPNGSVPSAINVYEEDTRNPLWVDHQDAGSYLIMLIHDYISWTGDLSILDEQINGRSIFVAIEDVLTYISLQDTDGDLMPEKQVKNGLKDWLDSIPRTGEVLYNQALYYKALRDMVDLATVYGEPTHALAFHRHASLLRYQVNTHMWNEEVGSFYESCDGDVCVDRLTNDSFLAILYELIYPGQRQRMFDTLLRLETRRNSAIPYGDWGVVNAFPTYEHGGKSYYYQNSTDWPFLDGMNTGARLKFGDPNWYYPMTRWWIWWAASGRDGALPEFVSPIDDTAGLSQAWSVNPIFSLLRYGFGIDPDIHGEYELKKSPIGDTTLKNIFVRGKRINRTFLK